jgi:hypothetical protein
LKIDAAPARTSSAKPAFDPRRSPAAIGTRTWESVLRLFADGKLRPEQVIDGVYPIERWPEAFAAMQRGQHIKAALRMPFGIADAGAPTGDRRAA